MEDYFSYQQKANEQGTIRPGLLTLLCVMTFIGSGLTVLSDLIITIYYDTVTTGFKYLMTTDINLPGLETFANLGRDYYVIGLVLSGASLYGALEMWRLKKIGFHFYAIANLLAIIVSMMYLGVGLSAGTLFFSIAFIAMYAFNLKYMTK